MLSQLVRDSGGVVTLAARLPDDAARVADALRQARAENDVVLTIGGVSAGDFDPVKQAVSGLADVELWRGSPRPGPPPGVGARGGGGPFSGPRESPPVWGGFLWGVSAG